MADRLGVMGMELSMMNSSVPAAELVAWAGEDQDRQRAVELLAGYDGGWFVERGSVALREEGTETVGLSVEGLRGYGAPMSDGDRLVLAAAAHCLDPTGPWSGPTGVDAQTGLGELPPEVAARVKAIAGQQIAVPEGRFGLTVAPLTLLRASAGADRGKQAAVELLARHDGGWLADQSNPWIGWADDLEYVGADSGFGGEDAYQMVVTDVWIDSWKLREAIGMPSIDAASKDVALAAADLIEGVPVSVSQMAFNDLRVRELLAAVEAYMAGVEEPWPAWSGAHLRYINGTSQDMLAEVKLRNAGEREYSTHGVPFFDSEDPYMAGPVGVAGEMPLSELPSGVAAQVDAIAGERIPVSQGRAGLTMAPLTELRQWAGTDRGKQAAVELLARHDGGWLADQSNPWIEPVHNHTVPVSQVEAGTELNATGVRLDAGTLREAARLPGLDDASKDVARVAADLIEGARGLVATMVDAEPKVRALIVAADAYVAGYPTEWPTWSGTHLPYIDSPSEAIAAEARLRNTGERDYSARGVPLSDPAAHHQTGVGASDTEHVTDKDVEGTPSRPEWSWGQERSWSESSPDVNLPTGSAWDDPGVAGPSPVETDRRPLPESTQVNPTFPVPSAGM